jgi:hypothetical protein
MVLVVGFGVVEFSSQHLMSVSLPQIAWSGPLSIAELAFI